MIWFRLLLLRLSLPITRALGKLHAPFSHRLTNSSQYITAKRQVYPGCILLSRIRGEFSNFFIPGFFTHAAMYVGGPDDLIVEAVGEGVRKITFAEFVLSHDYVAILQPRFLTVEQMVEATKVAESAVGTPYDFFFEPSTKAFYCSELVQFALHAIAGDAMPFTRRDMFGEPSVTPSDFWQARDKFDMLWATSQTWGELNEA